MEFLSPQDKQAVIAGLIYISVPPETGQFLRNRLRNILGHMVGLDYGTIYIQPKISKKFEFETGIGANDVKFLCNGMIAINCAKNKKMLSSRVHLLMRFCAFF